MAGLLSDTYIIADARERNVLPFLEDALQRHVLVVKQITTADYIVCRRADGGEPQILAAVERKTFKDFAASLCDGRYANMQKMFSLRRETGCQLFLVVEGTPAFPRDEHRFAHVPYSSIKMAMMHQTVRDGVFVARTGDESATADYLRDLLLSYDAVVPAGASGAPAHVPAGASGAPAHVPAVTGAGVTGASATGATGVGAVPAVLTKIQPPLHSDAVRMWEGLKGISIVLGKKLTGLFSAAALASGEVSAADIAAVKTPTGRVIGRKAAKSLRQVARGDVKYATRLLCGINKVGAQMAEAMLGAAGGSLAALCRFSVAQLGEIRIAQAGRTIRLGLANAERIHQALHYVEPDEGSAGPAATTAVQPAPSAAAASSRTITSLDGACARGREHTMCATHVGPIVSRAGPSAASMVDAALSDADTADWGTLEEISALL